MMFRNRSWVIGRGVETFSICSAMAFASKMPTQMDRTRSPSLSFRITMGMFVMGSTISPLMLISISMALLHPRPSGARSGQDHLAPETMRARPRDSHRDCPPDPRVLVHVPSHIGRHGHIHYSVAAGAPRNLANLPPAG